MQAARLLIRAGHLEHARVFLEQAEPASEDGRIERLFLLGRIEMRLGMPATAAERFEAILAVRPDLTRVRLDLARAYFLAGVDDRARHHFRASLARDLPTTVEAAVENFLRRIDARNRWSVSVSASMLPETRRPERETVLISGVPFHLNEDARSGSGAGVLLASGASFSPPLTGNIKGVLAASAAAKLYERSNWNEITATGEVGVAHLFEGGNASGGVRITRLWTGGGPERNSLGPWARASWNFSNATRFDVSVAAEHRRHGSAVGRDGWRVAVEPRLAHAFSGRISIAFEPAFEAISAEEGHFGSRLVGVGATLSHALEGGTSVSLSASSQIRRHAAPNPLFGTRRIDRTRRVALRVLHQSWRFGRFVPYVGYSLERARSSIPVYEHRVQGLTAGVTLRY